MFSKEKEYVPFHSQCDCVGPVSRLSPWRCEVVTFMVKCKVKRFLVFVEKYVNWPGLICFGIFFLEVWLIDWYFCYELLSDIQRFQIFFLFFCPCYCYNLNAKVISGTTVMCFGRSSCG